MSFAESESVDPLDTSAPFPPPEGNASLQAQHQDRMDSVRTGWILGNRSRSNTATSTMSSSLSAVSCSSSAEGSLSRSSSQDSLQTYSKLGSGVERSSSNARSFFGRMGKRSKRYHGKFSLSSQRPSLTGIQEYDSKVDYVDDPNGVDEARCARRRKISEPYNFHHITHTLPGQFQELDKTSPGDLASEFSAVRASQASRPELRGIKAENLHFKNFSSEELCPPSPDTKPAASLASPVTSTQRLAELRDRARSNGETFSRSASVHHRAEEGRIISPQSPGRPILAPPRTSSRAAVTLNLDLAPSQTSPVVSKVEQAVSSCRAPKGQATRPSALELSNQANVPHAMTTPDDSAWPLKPPSPIESEHPVDQPGQADLTTPLPGSFHCSANVDSWRRPPCHTQSLSDIKANYQKRHSRLLLHRVASNRQKERTVSQGSDTLGGPECQRPAMRTSGVFSGLPKHFSVGLGPVEGCWEDDIDYCYEHAAEADCNYEWDRFSDKDALSFADRERDDLPLRDGKVDTSIPRSTGRTVASTDDSDRETQPPQNTEIAQEAKETSRPPLLVATHLDVPDLDRSPIRSGSTFEEPEAVTPSHLLPPRPSHMHRVSSSDSFREADGFPLSPSLLIPGDYVPQYLREDGYQELLGQGDEKERQYPMFDRTIELLDSAEESLGSASTPLSKCNSQESILNLVQTLRHRSANSAGSLPELVHSRARRDEFDTVVKHLADHIAALDTVEEAMDRQSNPASPIPRKSNVVQDSAGESVTLKHSGNNRSISESRPPTAVSSGSHQRISSNSFALSNRSRSGSRGSSTNSAGTRRASRASYTVFPTS
ncbi:MAG: hypothetical protein M1837_000658 [Sclerophora amabilis]|nr:MAG: hypothetical protein M1837_000658 [Sclerophora amabilis]